MNTLHVVDAFVQINVTLFTKIVIDFPYLENNLSIGHKDEE